MKLILKKIKEVDNPRHPNNIPEGDIKEIKFDPKGLHGSMIDDTPVVGKRFGTWYYSTSPVIEIIDQNTFRTYNSIYKWEIKE